MTEKWLARGDVQNCLGPRERAFARYFPDFADAQSGLSWVAMTKPADRLLYAEPRPDGRTPYWTTGTIWAAAEGKPAVTVAIENLNILDAVVWFGGPKHVEPTVRRIAERARDIFSADLSYPIIMTRSGDVLDGAHRIAKAYLQGERTIAAVVIDDYPPPDGVVEVPQS
jgi:hypothetical protein